VQEAFSKEEENNILKERNERQETELKKLGSLYSEHFLKRILRLLEVYSTLATTFVLTFL
jgi:hypothetical protein